MTYLAKQDWHTEIARGNIAGLTAVNKFGRGRDCDSGVDCDIWDRNNATDTQDIWTAPTTARTHDITSTSANDDGSPAGTGCRTLRVWGLTGWGTAEVNEDITMNGTSNVATANSYVIIHRMRALTWGSAGPNVGTITATAQTDATVTAQIQASEGQTQMAIYGVPSTQALYLDAYYASAIKGAVSISAAISLLVNEYADNQLAGFVVKHTNGLATDGTNFIRHQFRPPFKVQGPAIVKVQANTSSNNVDVSAGFDGFLE